MIEKNCPQRGRLSADDRRKSPRIVKLCNAARRAVRAARRRHEPGRRRLPGRRRRDDRAHADEARSSRSISATATPSSSRAWSTPRSTSTLTGTGYPLRARSVEPGRLHDRRQRGHQRRRAAHAQVRRHGQPRARRRGRDGRRRDRPASAARPKIRPASTWSARSSAAKARWRSSPRSGSG